MIERKAHIPAPEPPQGPQPPDPPPTPPFTPRPIDDPKPLKQVPPISDPPPDEILAFRDDMAGAGRHNNGGSD